MIKNILNRSFMVSVLLLLLISCSPGLFPVYQNENIPVSDIEVSEELQAFVQPYKTALDEAMGEVIATSAQPLIKLGAGEFALGNLVADMQKEFAEQKFGYPVDISVMNNGGIRNSLPEGPITIGNIYELSPFDNYLYILELGFEDVLKLGNYVAEQKKINFSGMVVESKEGKLVRMSINGKEPEIGRTYLLAINDYLANGGDQMGFLTSVPRKEKSTYLLREMLIDRFRSRTAQGELIEAKIEGRQIHD